MGLPSGLRLDVEDQPTDADVEACRIGWKPSTSASGRVINPGSLSASSCAMIGTGTSSRASPGRPMLAGSSSGISGCLKICAARGSDANSSRRPKTGHWNVVATRLGSTPSASRLRASIEPSATKGSARSTGRPTTSASSCASGWISQSNAEAHPRGELIQTADPAGTRRSGYRAGRAPATDRPCGVARFILQMAARDRGVGSGPCKAEAGW